MGPENEIIRFDIGRWVKSGRSMSHLTSSRKKKLLFVESSPRMFRWRWWLRGFVKWFGFGTSWKNPGKMSFDIFLNEWKRRMKWNYSIHVIRLFSHSFAQFHDSKSKQIQTKYAAKWSFRKYRFNSRLPRLPNPITQSINPLFFCRVLAAFREQLFLEYYLPKIPFRSARSSIVRTDFQVNWGKVGQLHN